MEIKDHKLVGENIRFHQTPRIYGKYSGSNPDTIIIHYTAGHSTETAVRVLSKPKNVRPVASAHMVVGMDAEIVQLANLNNITAHAGRSGYKLPTDPNRNTFNKHSIGIEISNPGYLKEKDGKFYTWYKQEIPKEKVFEGRHRNSVTRSRFWHKYPQTQIDRVYEICRVLLKAYPSIKYILGHEEIAPGRKTDPGPAFPLDQMRKDLGVWEPGTEAPEPDKDPMPEGTVGTSTGTVNFRSGPSTHYEKTAEALEKGEKVEVLNKADDWYEVKQIIIGWIHRDYVDVDTSDDEFDGVVTANVLNIRSAPMGEKVAKPLKKGAEVHILDQQDGWFKVSTKVAGWVYGKYIEI